MFTTAHQWVVLDTVPLLKSVHSNETAPPSMDRLQKFQSHCPVQTSFSRMWYESHNILTKYFQSKKSVDIGNRVRFSEEHPGHLLLGCIPLDAKRQPGIVYPFCNLMSPFIKFRMLTSKKAETQYNPHRGMKRREECEICGEIVWVRSRWSLPSQLNFFLYIFHFSFCFSAGRVDLGPTFVLHFQFLF